jgi:hypothetical protein
MVQNKPTPHKYRPERYKTNPHKYRPEKIR